MPSYTHEEATNAFRLPAERDIRRTKTLNVRIEDPANADRERKLKHEQLRQYFHSTFEIYEKVFEPLASDEAFTIPPVHKLRHPLIFYLGHTATFYMNKLCLAGLTTRIDHFFEETFAIGVDEMSWDDLNEAHYNWPTVQAVWNYRRAVRERVDSLFREYNFDLPLTFDKSTESKHDAFYWAVLMGCEHERIHLETASVHVRELPMRLVNPSAFWEPCAEEGEVPKGVLPMIEFPGGKVKVGRDRDSEVYGWDCDYADNLVMDVAPFKASEHIISNFEFYEFIKEGGYTNREFWDEEGWNWVSWKHPEHPWFWVKTDDGFRLRCQTVEIDMKWSWPCEVNNLEAYAYLQWLGKKLGKPLRMPTEAEWLHMRDVCLGTKGSDQHEWAVAPGNINLEHHCSSCPVKKYKQGKLYDVIGNVWQHCETSVYPYEGFKVHPLYDDFSMPTFDGRHRCMKGGTWISTGNEATRDARFAFRRHFFQFIGIRVIEGEPVDETRHTKNVLGMDPPVDLAAHCSYTPLPDGSDAKDVYPKVLADLAVATYKRHAESKPANRALDLLCGAGRASYELSLTFKQVLGVDFSCRLLQPAYAMRERGMTPYSFVTDSATGARKAALAEAKDFEWRGRREDVVFYQSDPANLHAHIKDFDLILAFNITDQNTAYNPRAVPAHLVSRLTAGGILVVAEPKIKARNTSAPSTAEYMKLLAEAGAEVVEAPVTVPLYFPETQTAGRTLEFDVFAVRRK